MMTKSVPNGFEPSYSENNSWDGYYSVSVIRKELETDEEFQKDYQKEELELKRRKEDEIQSLFKIKK
jgi:hypothetical protein